MMGDDVAVFGRQKMTHGILAPPFFEWNSLIRYARRISYLFFPMRLWLVDSPAVSRVRL